MIPLAWLDQRLNLFLRDNYGFMVGLIFTGTAFVLIYAYAVRFLAVSFNTVEASMGRVTPSMDAAARMLGQTAGGALRKVHTPIMRGSLLAAGILVFVDVMKELPATIILRPFNFDTLAVRAYSLASDETGWPNLPRHRCSSSLWESSPLLFSAWQCAALAPAAASTKA